MDCTIKLLCSPCHKQALQKRFCGSGRSYFFVKQQLHPSKFVLNIITAVNINEDHYFVLGHDRNLPASFSTTSSAPLPHPPISMFAKPLPPSLQHPLPFPPWPLDLRSHHPRANPDPRPIIYPLVFRRRRNVIHLNFRAYAVDLGYGVGETRVVSVAGGRKRRCCGSIRGDICASLALAKLRIHLFCLMRLIIFQPPFTLPTILRYDPFPTTLTLPIPNSFHSQVHSQANTHQGQLSSIPPSSLRRRISNALGLGLNKAPPGVSSGLRECK